LLGDDDVERLEEGRVGDPQQTGNGKPAARPSNRASHPGAVAVGGTEEEERMVDSADAEDKKLKEEEDTNESLTT
jgi:hypothetical protein